MLLPCVVLFAFMGFSLICEGLSHYAEKVVFSKANSSFAMNFLYNTTYIINITAISTTSRGVMFQAISQGGIAAVSLDQGFGVASTTRGTSAGLIKMLQPNIQDYVLIYTKVESARDCRGNFSEMLVISAVEVTDDQPSPGGCNFIHSAKYYPLLDYSNMGSMAQVQFSPANVGFKPNKSEPVCDGTTSPRLRLLYDVYVYFLPYSYINQTCDDCSVSNYCDGTIRNNSFSDEINNVMFDSSLRGVKVKELTHADKTTFLLARTPCANMMIYVVVRDPLLKTSSKYIPVVIFGNNSPGGGNPTVVKIIAICLMILSSVLCLAGQRLFYFELFIFGAIFFAVISYIIMGIIIQLNTSINNTEMLGIASGIAVVGGLFIVALWWRFGYAVYFSFIVGLVGGFLFSCMIFATPLINLSIFRSQVTFCLSFVCIMLLYVLLLSLTSPYRMCIVTSSLVGSYMIVASLGAFICSMINQIVQLVLHRSTVGNFQKAIVVVSVQSVDYGLIAAGAVLFVCGCICQFQLQKSRPKFPESPYKLRRLQNQSTMTDTAINSNEQQSESATLSIGSASYTSENYEGDISDDIPDSSESTQASNQIESGEIVTDSTHLIH